MKSPDGHFEPLEPGQFDRSQTSNDGSTPGVELRPKQSRRIKARSHREEALSQLAAIVESCDDAIISQALDGSIASWNAAAERIYGYSAEEVMGQPISVIMPADRKEEMTKILDRIKRGERVDHFETVRIRKDARTINIALTVSPVRDASGKIIGASGVGRDISERYELERQKDEFLSLASHELRTPVTAIKGFAQLALRAATEADNRLLIRYLRAISSQTELLSRLVNDLLDVSQLESGVLPLHSQRFDLRELVQEVIKNAELLNPDFALALQLPPQPAIVSADVQLIQEVVANLVDNATKYSAQSREVEISLSVASSEAITAVRDFGLGIPAGQQDKVFDRFYRASNARVRTHRGLGLGLYISRSIVERHGGRMWLESTADVGSTFYFALPLAAEDGPGD